MERVLFIGAGELGSSLASLLAGVEVKRWDKEEGKVPDQELLDQVSAWASVVLFCIPSWAMRASLNEIAPHLKAKAAFAFAKGIEGEENLTAYEMMRTFLPDTACGAVGGPMLAEEIQAQLTTRGIVGGPKEAYEVIRVLYAGTNLAFDHTEDGLGVSLCGVLKNVYAVGFGIASALKLGSNFNGILMTEALREMHELLPVLGATGETAYSLAGAGDLITTGFSDFSRNRVCGKQLVETGTCNMDTEGMISIPYLLKRLEGQNLPPFLGAMKHILIDKKNVAEEFANLSRS